MATDARVRVYVAGSKAQRSKPHAQRGDRSVVEATDGSLEGGPAPMVNAPKVI